MKHFLSVEKNNGKQTQANQTIMFEIGYWNSIEKDDHFYFRAIGLSRELVEFSLSSLCLLCVNKHYYCEYIINKKIIEIEVNVFECFL